MSVGYADLSHIMMRGWCMLPLTSVNIDLRRRRRLAILCGEGENERVGICAPPHSRILRQLARRRSSGLTRSTAGRGGGDAERQACSSIYTTYP